MEFEVNWKKLLGTSRYSELIRIMLNYAAFLPITIFMNKTFHLWRAAQQQANKLPRSATKKSSRRVGKKTVFPSKQDAKSRHFRVALSSDRRRLSTFAVSLAFAVEHQVPLAMWLYYAFIVAVLRPIKYWKFHASHCALIDKSKGHCDSVSVCIYAMLVPSALSTDDLRHIFWVPTAKVWTAG